jgi:hypothetical protein
VSISSNRRLFDIAFERFSAIVCGAFFFCALVVGIIRAIRIGGSNNVKLILIAAGGDAFCALWFWVAWKYSREKENKSN